MLKKTVTYTDYNGVGRTEDLYFNLTKAEVLEMEGSTSGGLTNMVERLYSRLEVPELIRIFKELILKSYGEKSPDGRLFVKNKELADAFSQTEAYSNLFVELLTDAEAAADFVNGILPIPHDEETRTKIRQAMSEELAKKGLPATL